MNIAAFYSDSPFAGWVQAEGFADVLKRMGHNVIAIAVPTVTRISSEQAARINKPIEGCDLVIVSGPEHLRKWIEAFYPNWNSLKCPKAGWYHESFVREDYSLDYAKFDGMFDYHFFPDRNDAEKYGGEWLPLGVDAEMFHPGDGVRDIDIGFIGLMYPKRARFVEELTPHLGDLTISYMTAFQSERGLVPAINVFDADGLNIRRSMELLAETYRRIKVFVTFPSLSNVLVAKVLESMASGCRLVAPKQPVTLGDYFPYDSASDCASQIKRALENPVNGVDEILEHHRMEFRLEQILRRAGLCEFSSQAAAVSSATI